ncbi:MAG: phosphoesterase PA-phosphatase related protein [Gemmatimonadetes bacterium]|nr:phosphoesterase PA-phosphatase related protein [Gemmatimonadota bacterium]
MAMNRRLTFLGLLILSAGGTAPASLAAQQAHKDTTKTFFTRRDLAYTAVALAGTGVVSIFDKRIAHYTQTSNVQGGTSRHDLANKVTHVNETTLTAAAILSYGVGRLTHSETIADVAAHTTESLLLTSAISQIIRGPLGRERPSISPNDQYKFDFGKGFTHFDNRAFPSLHSATAFAAAAALVGEIHERNPSASWYAAPLLYTAAAVPGLTRMYLNQHWASDVVAGAFVGTLIGSRVVSYAHSHKRTKLDRVLLGTSVVPDGRGGAMVSVSLQP